MVVEISFLGSTFEDVSHHKDYYYTILLFFVGNPNLNLVFGDFPRGDFGNRLGHFFVARGLLGRDENFSLLQGGPPSSY